MLKFIEKQHLTDSMRMHRYMDKHKYTLKLNVANLPFQFIGMRFQKSFWATAAGVGLIDKKVATIGSNFTAA